MEKHALFLQEAGRNLRVASHMLVQTYPMVGDPKMLLTITGQVLESMNCSIASLLQLERTYKRIPPYEDDFKSRLDAFRFHVVDRYNIDRSYLLLMTDMKKMMDAHKQSSVVFSRKDKYVICTDGYFMHELTEKRIKEYIIKAKEFLMVINGVVSQNG